MAENVDKMVQKIKNKIANEAPVPENSLEIEMALLTTWIPEELVITDENDNPINIEDDEEE